MIIRVVTFFLLFLFFVPQSLKSQINRIHETMPSITPMSPEVAGISKFSAYPVNYYTGLPEISIPLFDVKTKDLNLPIVLKYHASGIKVADVASWVGLGWTLEAGGVINRKICGREDEYGTGPDVRLSSVLNSTFRDVNVYDYYLRDAVTKQKDTEPDYYNYSYPGRSGSFQFLNGSTFLMPLAPVKIQQASSKNIIEADGTSFYFGQPVNNVVNYPSKSGSDPVSTWLLTKILNSNKSDSIVLSYQSAGFGTLSESRRDYVTVVDYACPYPGECSDFAPGITYSDQEIVTTSGEELVNADISFNGGKISFVLSTVSRQDREAGFKSLDTIKIYTNNDLVKPFRYIIFHKSYFVNGTYKRLKLDSLRFADKNKKITQRYKFEYNTENMLPDYNSRSKDWWGYYNGKQNSFLIPRHLIPYATTCGGSIQEYIGNDWDARNPDTAKMKAYSLKSVTFPTGGKTTFKFESNSYQEGGVMRIAGGLRIKKIVTDDGNGRVQLKTYQYNQSRNNGYQYTILNDTFPNLSVFKSASAIVLLFSDGSLCSKRSTIYSSDPSIDLDPYDGSSVVYPMVTEYFGDELNNSGKIVYNYNDQADDPIHLTGNFSSIAPYAPLIPTERPYSDNIKLLNRSFQRGQLLVKSTYKRENNQYKLVHKVENQYGFFPSQTIYNVATVIWREDIIEGSAAGTNYWSKYNWDNYPAFTADNMLKYTAEYSYDQNDENKFVKNETFYTYNSSQYLQINKIKNIRSDGDTLIRVIKYPTDISNSISNGMVASNIVGVPIEENEFMESTPLTSTRANYTKKYFNKFYAPSSIDQKTGTSPWETRLRYLSYDSRGNIISVKKEKDIPVSYMYDGFNQPVAEVQNADSLSFYFNSFENADGNSVLNDSKTGRKSRLGGFNRTIPLTAGSYVLTYWQKYGVEWVYVKTTISASSGTYTINRTGQIDDLRIYPASAQITTYTYDPIIGMTSKTDSNGVTTYYEYDASGRLQFIKNDKRQVLKSYDYHYKNTD